jgi:uncharacterized protein (TIGR00251 family)
MGSETARDGPSGPLSHAGGTALLRIKATPRARKAQVGGLIGDADGQQRLIVKVTAPPDKGRANDAILVLLARQLGLPLSRLSLLQGETSREKTVRIEADADLVAKALKLTAA